MAEHAEHEDEKHAEEEEEMNGDDAAGADADAEVAAVALVERDTDTGTSTLTGAAKLFGDNIDLIDGVKRFIDENCLVEIDDESGYSFIL